MQRSHGTGRGTRLLGIISVLFTMLALSACSPTTTERLDLPALQVVGNVELERYMGTWYEIANYPHPFQEGCVATTASYSLRDDGRVDVLNRCRKGGLEGEVDEAKGIARVLDSLSYAKLQVSFFRPFWGDYWIIELAEDYRYAVVGHPGRDYLWILSRTPGMSAQDYAQILQQLESRHQYDIGRLVETVQPLP